MPPTLPIERSAPPHRETFSAGLALFTVEFSACEADLVHFDCLLLAMRLITYSRKILRTCSVVP